MPVFLVKWEVEGCIPVEAATAEEARQLAEDSWDDEIRNYSHYDAIFSPPRETKCMEEARFIDHTFEDGDCCVVNSDKPLKDLLPSDPNYTNSYLEKMKKYAKPS